MGRSEGGTLQIRTLGRFEVLVDGIRVPEERWPRQRTKKLLKILLTAPGQPFTFDQLVDALLPQATVETAIHNIQARASELRRVLEPDLIRGRDSQYVVTVGDGYLFNADSVAWIDHRRFTHAIGEAQQLADAGRLESAMTSFEGAVALYRGDFLAEDRYAEWAESTRSLLRDQLLECLTRQADCYAELGRLRQAIGCCQRALSMEPHRESVARTLMTYQAQAGQRERALETYRDMKHALREYLDVEPAEESRELFNKLSRFPPGGRERLDHRRIAVLPLANYSPDAEDEYLADGMTEELIACLSKIGDLRVVARTSVMRYKNSRRSTSEISRELGVGTLIEGSVRKAEDGVRVSVQLIDGASEDHLWAEEYDRGRADFLSTQRDVAEQVARSLRMQLLPIEKERIQSPPTPSMPAHALYMKGLRQFEGQSDSDLEKTISYYEEAIAIDPRFARAHAKIAITLLFLARSAVSLDSVRPRVRASIDRALSLDPQLSEAHAARGLFHWVCERDSMRAEEALRRAIDINPSYIEAREWLEGLMRQQGRDHEALAEARETLALNSLLPDLYCDVSRALLNLRRYEEAIEFYEAGGELSPDDPAVLAGLASAKQGLWRWDEAAEHWQRLNKLLPSSLFWNAGYVVHLHSRGRIEESLKLIRSFPPDQSNEVQLAHLEGRSLVFAGRYREAIDVFSRCTEQHKLGLVRSGWVNIHALRAVAHGEVGEYDEALHYFRLAQDEARTFEASKPNPYWETGTALMKARAGDDQAVPIAIERLLDHPDNAPVWLAILYFAHGDLDQGFEWLNTAVDQRGRWIAMAKIHPWFDPGRADPRFHEVLGRMNLTD
jgi:TolB-like protein/two-component SAPR family response regulator/Tfp pilus assembly protein PilF